MKSTATTRGTASSIASCISKGQFVDVLLSEKIVVPLVVLDDDIPTGCKESTGNDAEEEYEESKTLQMHLAVVHDMGSGRDSVFVVAKIEKEG